MKGICPNVVNLVLQYSQFEMMRIMSPALAWPNGHKHSCE